MQSIWVLDFPALLARYRRAYPGIKLKLQHTTSRSLLEQLRAGQVDLIVATMFGDLPDDLVRFPVFRSPFVVVDAADGVLAGRKTVTLGQLAQIEQVGFSPEWGIRILVDQMMHSANLEARVDFEVNDTHTVLDMVEAGLGVAVIPQQLARLRPNLRAVAIRGARCEWTIAAQSLAPAPANPAARALWKMLRAEAL